jgi:hypothetical protein
MKFKNKPVNDLDLVTGVSPQESQSTAA